MRTRLLAGTLAGLAGLGLSTLLALPAAGVQVEHDRVTNQNPVGWTPHALDGRVRAIVQVGSHIVVGGTFTQIRAANDATVINRRYLFAFDATTGVIDNRFQPTLDAGVFALAPAADGRSVYVGGQFNLVNGASRRKVARLDLATGQQTAGFRPPALNGTVKDLKAANGRLYAAGTFTKAGATARTLLASLDPATGTLGSDVSSGFAGPLRGGALQIIKMDVTPSGDRLVATGNFSVVDGQRRHQVVMLDLTSNPARVANWYTPRFEPDCALAFDTYMRDVDFSPDGSYLALVTTGAFRGGPPILCDTASRWETYATGENIAPTWVNYTGGDTLWGVGVTGTAVYVGGHQRWVNNPFRGDNPGPGAVARSGIAALDPRNGLPYSWNPGRSRGVGVFDLTGTSAGLWMGSDTDRTFGELHGRIALFPLAGGSFVPPDDPGVLPGQVYGLGSEGDSSDVVRRSFDGAHSGPTFNLGDMGVTWEDSRGAVMLSGRVYYGMRDGTLRTRTFDGTDFGAEQTVNLNGLTEFAAELPNVTGMFYDEQRGRLYYTLAGQNTLYYRWFTPESRVVGAQRFVAASNVAGLDLANVGGMFMANERLYVASSLTGNLTRATFAGGTVTPGTATVVSGPTTDGTNWRARGLFVFSG